MTASAAEHSGAAPVDDVSIVIVNWNGGPMLLRCVTAAVAAARDVIVIDNASADASADAVAVGVPAARVLRQPRNLGFAGGVNVGVAAARHDAVLLLNPDAVASAVAVRQLRDTLLTVPGAGAVGGCLVGDDGRPQQGFVVRRFPTLASWATDLLLVDDLWPRNPARERYLASDIALDGDAPVEVDQPAAACLMVSRQALARVGGLDEGFSPAWFEDVDLCRRLHTAGVRVLYEPRARVQHSGGVSLRTLERAEFARIWYRNLRRYATKHHSLASAVAVRRPDRRRHGDAGDRRIRARRSRGAVGVAGGVARPAGPRTTRALRRLPPMTRSAAEPRSLLWYCLTRFSTVSLLRLFCLVAVSLVAAVPARAQVTFRDAADRDAFRRWFVVLADAQFYRTTADVTDCAALVRHAVREATRTQSPDWLRRTQLPGAVTAPATHATVVERDGALLLFRVKGTAPPVYGEFADAKTIVRLNSRPLGRDVQALRPGDLLYFRQEGQDLPDHVMVFVGPSPFEADGRDWVVYHTGPSPSPGDVAATAGEVRKVRLSDLRRHPSPRWRPVPSNAGFVGVYRLSFFIS